MANTLRKSCIRSDFSRAAPRYREDADLQADIARLFAAFLPETFEEHASVLDLGCGPGVLIKNLAHGGRFVTQLDLAWGMCERARFHGPVVNADMENLPFCSGSFGAVVSSLAFQWASDFPALLEEIRRVLKQDGALYFTTFGADTLKELRQAFILAGLPGRVHDFPGLEDLREMLVRAGFRLAAQRTERQERGYRNLAELFGKLKASGGNNKSSTRQIYLGKEALRRLRESYPAVKEENIIRAAWEVHFIHAERE